MENKISTEEHVKAIFRTMPHIHTVWVKGDEWRFYDFPGSTPVEKADAESEKPADEQVKKPAAKGKKPPVEKADAESEKPADA